MIPRHVACLSGVLGGACWVLRWFVGDEGGLSVALRWGGAMWLVIALAALGAGVVRRGNVGIRTLVAVALPVLGWALLSVAQDAGDPLVVEAIAGGVAILVFLGLLLTGRGDDRIEAREHGRRRRS